MNKLKQYKYKFKKNIWKKINSTKLIKNLKWFIKIQVKKIDKKWKTFI